MCRDQKTQNLKSNVLFRVRLLRPCYGMVEVKTALIFKMCEENR